MKHPSTLAEIKSRYFAEFWESHTVNEDLKTRVLSLMYDAKHPEKIPEDWKWIYYNLAMWYGTYHIPQHEQIEYAIENYYTGKIYDRSGESRPLPVVEPKKPKSNNQLFLIF